MPGLDDNAVWLAAAKSPGLAGLTALYDSSFTEAEAEAKAKSAAAAATAAVAASKANAAAEAEAKAKAEAAAKARAAEPAAPRYDDDVWLAAAKSAGLTGLTALYDSTLAPAAGADEMQGLFALIDSNGDGVIQPMELQAWMKSNGVTLSIAEVYELYAQHDENKDGVLQIDEFAGVLRAYEAKTNGGG